MKVMTFKKGWEQLRVCDRERFREESMAVFGVKNRANFYSRMSGKTSLSAVEYIHLTELFRKYGVNDPWENIDVENPAQDE